MKKLIYRIALLLVLFSLYLLSNYIFDHLVIGNKSIHTLRFELPFPEEIIEKYDIQPDEKIDKVIVAGYFSEWDPTDSNFQMTQVDDETYEIQLALEPGDNQYKFVVYFENREEPIWTHDINSKYFVDDNFGGLNSVIRVRDLDRLKLILDIFLLGFMGIIIIFSLTKPVVEWIMRQRISIKTKLVVIVCLIGVFTNLVFITYNYMEKRSLIKEGLIESMNLIHNFLLGADMSFSSLNDEPDSETWESTINTFFDTAEARNERFKPSNRQIIISKFLIFDTNFNIIAMGDREESIDIEDYTNNTYFREVMFSNIITNMLTNPQERNQTQFFQSGDYRLYYESYERWASFIGFDAAIHPIHIRNQLVGYYGISIHTTLFGKMLSDILKFNLFLIIVSVILLLLLISSIGTLFIKNLDILYQWTNKTVQGDFSTEVKINSKDEIQSLAMNFNKMRLSLDKYLRELKIMNTLTGILSGITRVDDLYQILLIFLTADFGFQYNRAAVFLKQDNTLVGKYSIGLLNEEELLERFGSYHNYATFKLEIADYIRNYKSILAQNKTHFDQKVRETVITLKEDSIFLQTIRENKMKIVRKNKQLLTSSDLQIVNDLNLEEFILLPIILEQEVIGVLILDSYFHKRKIEENDTELIQIFNILLNDFAVNMENVQLIRGLEEKVDERTEQIKEVNEKLQLERDKLKTRNLAMENDLNLARTIQSMFIPISSPHKNIAFAYQPMEKVGGDFIDFYQLDNNRMGIFISDVSGHGVSAAFITSIIKSFSLQNMELMNNPDQYLIELNAFMMNIVPEKFVTAMFGIYDPQKKSFLFCNAGHPPPYRINNNGVALIRLENKGFPLAMLNPKEIKEMNVKFKSQKLRLDSGDRLFFFTDGLWETINIHVDPHTSRKDIPEYGETRLHHCLLENRHLKPNELIQVILEDLVEFRGSYQFDDDVCMVCIDYE